MEEIKKRQFSDFCLPNPHCVQWEGMVRKEGSVDTCFSRWESIFSANITALWFMFEIFSLSCFSPSYSLTPCVTTMRKV